MPKKLLFLTTQLPYPLISGGVIKSFKLLECLSKNYAVTLICPLKNKDQDQIVAFEKQLSLSKTYYKPIHKTRSSFNLLKSYLRASTLNVYRNFDAQIKKEVQAHSKNADLILIDHYEMGVYIPPKYNGKVILHQHNAEYTLWESMAKTMRFGPKKIAVLSEVSRIKAAEKTYCNKADLVWAAPSDIDALKKIGVTTPFSHTLHLGKEALLSYPALNFHKENKNLLFVGSLDWEANVSGLLWFIDSVWPLILAKQDNATLTVIGKNPDKRLIKAAKKTKHITFKGFVKHLDAAFLNAKISIAPLLFGSGIKVKVVEALYRGIPMITTSFGVQSLEVQNKKHICVCDDPKDFALTAIKLLEHKKTWTDLSKNSRAFASQHLRWEPLLKKHLKEIDGLLTRAKL